METLQLKIAKYYTDLNGVLLDKNTVPNPFKRKVPFYLFNLFDKNGGFSIAQTFKPVLNGMVYLYTYIVGAEYNFLDFQLGNNIADQLTPGDMVIVLGDDKNMPNYLCNIVIHSDYVSYGSFLTNLQGKGLKIIKIQYVTDNENNWQECFNMTSENDLGIAKDNQIQPLAFRSPYEYTFGLLDMTIDFELSDKKGINSYMLFDTDNIELNFYIDSFYTLTPSTNGNQQKAIAFRQS